MEGRALAVYSPRRTLTLIAYSLPPLSSGIKILLALAPPPLGSTVYDGSITAMWKESRCGNSVMKQPSSPFPFPSVISGGGGGGKHACT